MAPMCNDKVAPWTAAKNKPPVIGLDCHMIEKENNSGFRVGLKIIYNEITDFSYDSLRRIMYVICKLFCYRNAMIGRRVRL